MDFLGRWLPMVGIAYLVIFGDLRDSTVLNGFNPQVWWFAWFLVLLVCAVGHSITSRRSWATAELAVLLAVGSVRSVIYLMNDTRGPLGVWIIVIGLSIRAWTSDRYVTAPPDSVCGRAHFCQHAIDVDGELKNRRRWTDNV